MSQQPTNIHDSFFKQVLADPNVAATFLRERLPPEVAALLGPKLPERVPGSFIDEELRGHQSDILFRVQLTSGGEVGAYVLLEHKSAPDPLTRLQLLRYVTRILAQWYREHKRLPLPAVLPVVAHHGPKGWKFSTEFIDLFGEIPAALRPYLLSFRHALVDLAGIEDNALSEQVWPRTFLKVLKYILRPDLPQHLHTVLAEAGALELEEVSMVLTYIDRGPVAVSKEAIRSALQSAAPAKTEKTMSHILGHLSQDYIQQGLQQGLQKGLLRLLERRFGELPAFMHERISAATAQQLDAWFESAIDAPDLATVFGNSRWKRLIADTSLVNS